MSTNQKTTENFYQHPVGFLDTLSPDKSDVHATYRIDCRLFDSIKDMDNDSFKEHVERDLAHQIAAHIQERMDVFWRTDANGDQVVEASVRVLSEDRWRWLEGRLFDPYFEQLKQNYTDAWQSKQKWSRIPFGPIVKRDAFIVSPRYN